MSLKHESEDKSPESTQSDRFSGERLAYEVAAEREARSSRRTRNIVIVTLVSLVALVAIYALFLRGDSESSTAVNVNAETAKEADHGPEEGEEVMLTPEALVSAGIEIEGVTQRPAVVLIKVTGTVETNQQQTQQASALVSGRVAHKFLGDLVSFAGSKLRTCKGMRLGS